VYVSASGEVRARLVARITTPLILFRILQQMLAFDIGVLIVGIPHLDALAELGVRIVEETKVVFALSGGTNPAIEIPLRLANVLADDMRTGSTVPTRDTRTQAKSIDEYTRYVHCYSTEPPYEFTEPSGPSPAASSF
jgi:hypothetical protein